MNAPLLLNHLCEIEPYAAHVDGPDMMGTVCRVHHCARFMDEVPVLAGVHSDPLASRAKRERFPNSWNFVPAPPLLGRFSRTPAKRMTMARYCPECREAMVEWMQERA